MPLNPSAIPNTALDEELVPSGVLLESIVNPEGNVIVIIPVAAPLAVACGGGEGENDWRETGIGHIEKLLSECEID